MVISLIFDRFVILGIYDVKTYSDTMLGVAFRIFRKNGRHVTKKNKTQRHYMVNNN